MTTNQSTLHIVTRPIGDLKPYDKNPRVISDEAVSAVANSIREFGFRVPIIIDADGVIIAGHTRLLAARKLGLDSVPCHIATDLTPEQVRALRIADNKSAELSKWDYDILPIELTALQDDGFDVGLIGFTLNDIADMMADEIQEGLTDPDEVPDPPDAAITQRGDIWQLGRHRLMCGDSGSESDLDALLAGETIHLLNMDPPYNVKVEPRSNNACAAGLSSFAGMQGPHQKITQHTTDEREKKKQAKQAAAPQLHHQSFDEALHGKRKPTHKKLRAKDRPLANDFVGDEDFAQMLMAWFGNASRVLMPGGSFYIWGGYANLANYPIALKAHGLYFSQGLVWDKMHPVLTRKDFLGSYELAFYGWKEGAAHRFLGPNNERDLWHIKKIPPQSMCHLTEKPVELAIKAIQLSSKPLENVLDLFGGSGSTLIGCEQTNRRGFLMELDPLYCDVIVDRYQRFSGKPAVLERTGESPIPMTASEPKMK